MKLWDAMKLLKTENAKVRGVNWRKDIYLQMKTNYLVKVVEGDVWPIDCLVEIFFTEDWEIQDEACKSGKK
jgi:hypothetical protein